MHPVDHFDRIFRIVGAPLDQHGRELLAANNRLQDVLQAVIQKGRCGSRRERIPGKSALAAGRYGPKRTGGKPIGPSRHTATGEGGYAAHSGRRPSNLPNSLAAASEDACRPASTGRWQWMALRQGSRRLGMTDWCLKRECLHVNGRSGTVRSSGAVSITLQMPDQTIDLMTAGIERALNLPMSAQGRRRPGAA